MYLNFTWSLPTTFTWTMLSNIKEPNPITASVATRQVNVPFSSIVTLKIISLTKCWLELQSMPNRFSNPGSGPDLWDLTPAMVVPSNSITNSSKINSVKSNCQRKVVLMLPSWSCLLLKWSTGAATACTFWVGGGSFQVRLLPSEN